MRTEIVLQQALERLVVDRGALGATAAVHCDGLGAWSGAAGSGDIAKSISMAPDACMPAYSITKTMTAICAVRLAELGALSLDDPISKWVTELPFGDIVSLRQLLRHTSGVSNYSAIQEQASALDESPGRAWSFDQFVEASCRRGLDFEPGAGWSYSNTGYMLLKRVVERANGSSFGDAVTQHIAGPLGFSSTFAVGDSFASLAPGFSRQFRSSGPPEDVREVYDPGWCATGVVASTAAELCQMLHALFGGKLVLRDSLAQMTALCRVPGDHPPAVTPSYGLGLMADPDGIFGPEFGHAGEGPGYNLWVAHFPKMSERRVSIAVLCNTDEAEAAAIGRGLASEFRQQLGETFTLS
ncbi:MAG: serine hydrolase domain-containing protein [Myxococcota bacterium]